MDMAYVGDRIKKRRKELHLTIAQVRDKTGISTGNLSEIENGKQLPSAPALLGLSTALNCTCDWILRDDVSDNITLKSDISLDNFEISLIKELRTLSKSEQIEIFEIIKIKNKLKGEKSSPSQLDNSSKLA